MNIWDFWAKRYDKLWVQKYSLKPTRTKILNTLSHNLKEEKLLDLGSGPGELIYEIKSKYPDLQITGLDFSEGMIEVSKAKNPQVKHLVLNVNDLHKVEEKYDLIISSHSIPYYKHPREVMANLHRLLEDKGQVHIAFASANSLYDKFILSLVKLTTGSATYYSDKRFRQIVDPYFEVEGLQIIREKFFMPRIALYTLRKVKI